MRVLGCGQYINTFPLGETVFDPGLLGLQKKNRINIKQQLISDDHFPRLTFHTENSAFKSNNDAQLK